MIDQDYAMGPDYHKWYGPTNPARAIAAGADFFKIRSSIGIQEDEQFKRNADIITAPRSFWHFLSPFSDPIWQADFFCDLIEPLRWELRPGVDCETPTDPAHILPFCERVEFRLNVRPEIYTGAWWWNANVGNDPLFAAYDLWIALWNEGIGDPLTIEPCPPWETWKFWQFSADGNGRGAEFGCMAPDVDLNYFNGGLQELKAEMDAVALERYGAPPVVDPLEARVQQLEISTADIQATLAAVGGLLKGE